MKKLCSKCGVEKEITEFNKRKGSPDGHAGYCRECFKEYLKKYHKEHKKEAKEYYKNYKRKKSANDKEYYKEYYKANKEKFKEYYDKNKESIRKYYKEWKAEKRKTEEGRALLKSYKCKRRAKIKDVGAYTPKEWTSCLEFFNNCDAYTGEPLNGDVSIDHIVPIKAGGTNNINNLVPCKKAINSSKNAQDWLEWYRKQPFYSKKRENKINKWISINSQTNFFETIDNCYCEML